MKKILLVTLFTIGSFSFTLAQAISENALGLRLGGNDGVSIEISYQRALMQSNRLEIDFGLRNGNGYNGYKLAGIYQWLWEIDTNFNWYAGAGGGLSNYNFEVHQKHNGSTYKYSKTYPFIAGDIGVEYNFDIPLLVSLDFRPEIGSYYNGLGFDFAFGVRYQF